MWNWFWAESFWLPENTSWSDVTNGDDKHVVYAELRDLWSVVPLTLMIIVSRFILEKYCFTSVGRWMNIKDAKKRPVPYNAVLEDAYKKDKCTNPTILAKKVDMTERQVERWWRLRRSQDRSSILVKFSESMWRGSFHLCIFFFGIYTLWDKEWLWDVEKTFKGYPHQGITSEIWWYCMISSAFYWSLTITQFWDVRRKDFWQMFVHHIATTALLSFGWVCNLHRIGSLTILLHDSSDILMELAKAMKYVGCGGEIVIFAVFAVVWISTRLILFPIYILKTVYAHLSDSSVLIILFLLLCLLLALHVFWTWLILKVTYDIAVGKVVWTSWISTTKKSGRTVHSPTFSSNRE